MVGRIYPPELQLNKAYIPKPHFWIYIYLFQKDLFHPKFIISAMSDFDMVIFSFLDGDVPRSTSYGVYISQLIRFARVCSHVTELKTHNEINWLTSPSGLLG